MERGYTVSAAVVEQRRAAPLVHGVRSEGKVRNVARAQKRVILRHLGVRARDLDAVSAVYVDVLARSLAKAVMLDSYYAERGIVRPDGQGEPTLAVYMSALNQARLTAGKLAEHMARLGVSGDDLADYIDAEYGAMATASKSRCPRPSRCWRRARTAACSGSSSTPASASCLRLVEENPTTVALCGPAGRQDVQRRLLPRAQPAPPTRPGRDRRGADPLGGLDREQSRAGRAAPRAT